MTGRGSGTRRQAAAQRAATPAVDDDAPLDLRQVRHFLAVAEHGNFGRAAQQLGLSKQGLSQSISALEDTLGVRLFERGQFGSVPTEFGRALIQHAKVILAESRKARHELEGLRAEHRGAVTFALGSSFSEYVAPAAIRRFRAEHPHVELKVANVHPDNMVALVGAGELDFVAMGELRSGDCAGLERTPLFRMESHLLVPAGNPLARRRSLQLTDLVDQTFVGVWRDDLTDRTIEAAFRQQGLPPPRIVDCDNFLVTRGLVLDEGWLVIANRLFFERELASRAVVERRVPGLSYDVTYVLYHRRDTVLGRAARGLMDEIARTARSRFADSFVPLPR